MWMHHGSIAAYTLMMLACAAPPCAAPPRSPSPEAPPDRTPVHAPGPSYLLAPLPRGNDQSCRERVGFVTLAGWWGGSAIRTRALL